MNIHIAGIHLLSAASLATIKAEAAAAGHQVVAFAANELDKAVEAAKTTEIGSAAVAAIHAAEQPGQTGEQKMIAAIAALAPTVIDYVARGGFKAVVSDVEQFARQLLESTLADVKKTTAAQVATAVLAVAA